MRQYRSREAPIAGSSVSESHPGYWADHIKRENNIRDKWYNEFGHLYYKKACESQEGNYGHPIYSYSPQVKPHLYLKDGTVAPSEPVAYLRACMRQKQLQDAARKDPGKANVSCKCGGERWCAAGKHGDPQLDLNHSAKVHDIYGSASPVSMYGSKEAFQGCVARTSPCRGVCVLNGKRVFSNCLVDNGDVKSFNKVTTSTLLNKKNHKERAIRTKRDFMDFFPPTYDGQVCPEKLARGVDGYSEARIQDRLEQMFPGAKIVPSCYVPCPLSCVQSNKALPILKVPDLLPDGAFSGSLLRGKQVLADKQLHTNFAKESLPFRGPIHQMNCTNPQSVAASSCVAPHLVAQGTPPIPSALHLKRQK